MKRFNSVGKAAGMVLAVLFVLGMVLGVTAAMAAEKYPAKAVTVIHGFKAGGGSDQLAQVTQPFLEKVLKQRFVNVYKPGADGAIVWKEVGKDTKPDGYTLTTCLTPKTQLNSMVNANSGYSMADFEPIANMIFDPGILVVSMDSKFKTLQDLIDAAKKAPGQIKLSHSGNGGDDWFNGLMIAKLTGTSYNMVPFDGDAPAWQAAAGGHVDVCTTNVGVVTGVVQGKKLRALAVYTEKRLAAPARRPDAEGAGGRSGRRLLPRLSRPEGNPEGDHHHPGRRPGEGFAGSAAQGCLRRPEHGPRFQAGGRLQDLPGKGRGYAPQDRQGDETHPVGDTGTAGENARRPFFSTAERFSTEGSTMKERIVSIGILVFALVYFAGSISLKVGTLAQPGAGQFPAAIAFCLLVVAAYNVWRAFRKTRPGEERGELDTDRAGRNRRCPDRLSGPFENAQFSPLHLHRPVHAFPAAAFQNHADLFADRPVHDHPRLHRLRRASGCGRAGGASWKSSF